MKHLQTHSKKHIVDGIEFQSFTSSVKFPSQRSIHQETASAGVRRVERLIIQGLWDVILVLLFANGLGFVENVADKEVLQVFADFQILQDVGNADEHVVVAFEDVAGVSAVSGEPFEEVDLLEGQVEEAIHEVPLQDVSVDVILVFQKLLMVRPFFLVGRRSQKEKRLDSFTVDHLFFAPGLPYDLPSIVLGYHRLDDHQQVYISGALLWVIHDDGEVSAVPVKQELLEVGFQTREPLHGREVEVDAAVGAGDVPRRGALLLG